MTTADTDSLPARGRVGLDDPGTAYPLASSRGQGGLDGAGAVSAPPESPVSAPLDLDEPMCCGEPMISYAGGWFWECAEAYFTLQGDGVIYDDGASPPSLVEPDEGVVDLRRLPTAFHRELHAHLLATRLVTDDDGLRHLAALEAAS